jgi:hypothetical protein
MSFPAAVSAAAAAAASAAGGAAAAAGRRLAANGRMPRKRVVSYDLTCFMLHFCRIKDCDFKMK